MVSPGAAALPAWTDGLDRRSDFFDLKHNTSPSVSRGANRSVVSEGPHLAIHDLLRLCARWSRALRSRHLRPQAQCNLGTAGNVEPGSRCSPRHSDLVQPLPGPSVGPRWI